MNYKITTLILALVLIIFWVVSSKRQPDLITLKAFSFSELPGFKAKGLTKSFETFKASCKVFLAKDSSESVGSEIIPMQVKDWLPACRAAIKIKKNNDKVAKNFFKTWFNPVEFHNKKPMQGLFTGYYLPLLRGSLTKTEQFPIPIYGKPDNLVTVNLGDFQPALMYQYLYGRIEDSKLKPYYTREEINKGAISKSAPVLAWVENHVDRLFLEIQGSGLIELDNGKTISVGYAGENGAPYTPIGRVLIEKGVLTKENSSMQTIRAYLLSHQKEILPVVNQNKSFVFFRLLEDSAAKGAQGLDLTPGYSLAVDRKWIPLGTPLWLDTTRPVKSGATPKVFQRLMVAQDTGGAIRGTVRGDVFWGGGELATYIAGNMKNRGHYWLLLPKPVAKKLVKNFSYHLVPS